MTDITPLPWTWHPQSKDQAHTGSVYCLRRPGHAYAVAMQPRYQTDEAWNADAAFIVIAANHHHALLEIVEKLASFPLDEQNMAKRNEDVIYGFHGEKSWQLIAGDVRKAKAAIAELKEVSNERP